MGDIDFEELDKAVNSLMNSSDTSKGRKSTESANSRYQAIKAPMVRKDAMPTLNQGVSLGDKPASKSMDMRLTPTKSTKVTPAVRRSGRFMDVVDSSSELNPIRKPLVLPSRDAPRKAEPIASDQVSVGVVHFQDIPAPREPTPEAMVEAGTPEKPAQIESNSEPVRVRFVAKNTPVAEPLQLLQNDAPALVDEGIDTEGASDEDVRPAAVFGEPVTPVSGVGVSPQQPNGQFSLEITGPLEQVTLKSGVDAESIQQADQEVAPEETAQESDSPFLVDAKIEKRPLNANKAAITDPIESISADEVAQSNEQDIQPVQFDPVDSPVTQMTHDQREASEVPEFSSELVALEATGRAEYELDESPVPIKSSTDGNQKKKSAKNESLAGPTSIAQQYHSKESTGDVSHAPIYDASEYAEPVTHPAKKKSGWIWVLIIFLILAITSSGAVALYLTGIIP